jgi:hypothetical protein
MKKGIYALAIAFLLSSCAAVGTSTLHNADEGIQIKKIGFNQLNNDSILFQVDSQTDEIFTQTVFETLDEYGLNNSQNFKTNLSFDYPDRIAIAQLCAEYDLDGFILARLKFIHVTYSMYALPIAQNFDTEVEMKLFSKEGKLIIRTMHNTLEGNSYMTPPPAFKTIQDGTRGALKRIARDLGLRRIK